MASKRYAAVDKILCVTCGACEKACPLGAIKVHKGCFAKSHKTNAWDVESVKRSVRQTASKWKAGRVYESKEKHWYDYLWIWSVVYFTLGFFNILFAWLGMIDFLLPVMFAAFGGNKFFCSHLCGRGQIIL